MLIDLTISGLGLITAVGHGVVASAAAQRAGVSNPSPIPGQMVVGSMDDEDSVMAKAVGHRVTPLADGFIQTGLWIRLGSIALRDLIAHGELPAAEDHGFWSKTALMVVIPDVDSDRFMWPPDEVDNIVDEAYVTPLSNLLGLALARSSKVHAVGHAGWAELLPEIKASMVGDVERVMVLGVDTYLDVVTFSRLVSENRLKTADAPTGLIPGEGASCFLVQRNDGAHPPSAKIVASSYLASDGPPLSEDVDLTAFIDDAGRRLALVITEALTDAAGPMPFVGDLYVDLNGEEWRARVWGMATLQLAKLIDFDRCRLNLPCASFGEIGAASGPASVALAVRAFERGYAQNDRTLVISVCETGAVGAAVLGNG